MELSPVVWVMSVPSVGTQIDPHPNIARWESSEPPLSGSYVGFSLLLARPQGEGHLQESYLLGISTLKPLTPLNKQHPETELAHGRNSLPL